MALQALAELEQRMAASPVDTPDPETQRWFLRDRKFNVDEAVEKLEAAQRWRREFRCSRRSSFASCCQSASDSHVSALLLSCITAMQGQRDIRADSGSRISQRQGVLAHCQRCEPAPRDRHQGGQACDRWTASQTHACKGPCAMLLQSSAHPTMRTETGDHRPCAPVRFTSLTSCLNGQVSSRWMTASGCACTCWTRRSRRCQRAGRRCSASSTCAALATATRTWALSASWCDATWSAPVHSWRSVSAWVHAHVHRAIPRAYGKHAQRLDTVLRHESILTFVSCAAGRHLLHLLPKAVGAGGYGGCALHIQARVRCAAVVTAQKPRMCASGAAVFWLQQSPGLHNPSRVPLPCRWAIVKPWLRKYADLVCFVDRKQLAKEFFTPETLPPDFRHWCMVACSWQASSCVNWLWVQRMVLTSRHNFGIDLPDEVRGVCVMGSFLMHVDHFLAFANGQLVRLRRYVAAVDCSGQSMLILAMKPLTTDMLITNGPCSLVASGVCGHVANLRTKPNIPQPSTTKTHEIGCGINLV